MIASIFENGSPLSVALFASLVFNMLLLRALLQLVRLKSAAETVLLETLQTSASALTDAAAAARETAQRVAMVEITMTRMESAQAAVRE